MSYERRENERNDSIVEELQRSIADAVGSVSETLLRGVGHQRRLSNIDSKIVVSGTRGKSSLTDWLYEILYARQYDVYAKITGNHPVSKHAGEEYDIERDYSRVTLYETARELREHTPADAMILENQAISPYTTRVFNQYFGDPDVVVLSNVREDHMSTLGGDRYRIARSLVRAIPKGAHVVNGERDPHLRRYIDREVRRRGATVSHVTVPPAFAHIPGIESVYALNHVLAAIGEAPLDEGALASYREKMRVEWTEVPGGRIYNAAEVNDVQSTEMVRQALVGEGGETVEPFIYLRGDRRGRSVSFLHYLNELYEEEPDAFERVHVAGETLEAFERKAEFPVKKHDAEAEGADAVLDDLLSSGRPVLLMGNTVAGFMREIDEEIEARADRLREEREAEAAETNARAASSDDSKGVFRKARSDARERADGVPADD